MQRGVCFLLGVVLSAAFLFSFSTLRSEVRVNILGFKYESEDRQSPSLDLVIDSEEPVVRGNWTAQLTDKLRGRNARKWCPVSVEGKEISRFGIMVNEEDHPLFFEEKKDWAGEQIHSAPAGVFSFQGKKTKNISTGTFTFTPDTNYLAKAAGYLQEPPSATQMLQLALIEARLEEMQSFRDAGLKLNASDFLRFRYAGVTPSYAKAVNKAQAFKVDEIVRLKSAGVAETFPAAFREGGYDFDASQLIKLRNSGVAADEAVAWKKAGFAFDADGLVRIRNSGVSAAFGKQLKEAYPNLNSTDLVKLRNSGVSAEDAVKWKRAGYNWDVDGLVRLRNSGVTPELGEAVHGAFPNASSEDLVRLRNSGVTPDYLVSLKKVESKFTAEDIVRLRNSGVPAEYVATWLKAGTNLSAQDLVKLRNSGVPAEFASVMDIPGRKPSSVDTLVRLRNRGLSVEEIRELRE